MSVFLSLREARARGLALEPASNAPPAILASAAASIGPPFPAGRYLGTASSGETFVVYDERIWRWSGWRVVGRTPDGLEHRTRCLVPTLRARFAMAVAPGWLS